MQQKKRTFVEINDKNRVCIGGFCTIGSAFKDPKDYTLDTEASIFAGEVKASETRVYALQTEVDAFVSQAQEQGWSESRIRSEATNYFSQLSEVTDYKYEITKEKAAPQLKIQSDALTKLGLKDQSIITELKTEIFEPGHINVGSTQTTLTYNSGNGKTSYAYVTYNDGGGRKISPIRIPGSYSHKLQELRINDPEGKLTNRFRVSELVETITGKKVE